ncbi:PDR/VanB family oxidoreductase [Nocardioides luteus]|uniref:Oxidoreductase n=1 Tax=Nocardioides luteus TaxID=1844 RepID=A0A1J4NAF0_9ACTN|nr:PDR/VanB family oxidoreductase [Nocardioides luteus]OIJ27465.1 oxidoreductase [Nocardioides luteus]
MGATNNEVWQFATVVATRAVAADILRIELEPDQPAKADPGTHVDVKVQIGETTDKRSYSIVESLDEGKVLAISVQRAPASRGGSIYMHTLTPGDRIEITQPLQNFPLRIGAPKYILLAGGIGVTAIAAMASALRQVGADYHLVYAARSSDVMAYGVELQKEHGERTTLHLDDEDGLLDLDALVKEAGGATELYMCGPIRLMDAVRRSWEAAGHSLPNLRYETFGNSGWFEPEEFEVAIPRLEVNVTVGPGVSMLEALETAGVDMMFDCRRGECGLCEVRVGDLDGEIDHRDVFYSERQKDASAKMCCCVSRVVSHTDGAGSTPGVRQPRIIIDIP